MNKHLDESIIPLWRILLCVLFWCFFIIGAISTLAGDLILQVLGVSLYNANGTTGLGTAVYMLAIWPFTSAVVINGMRPVSSTWWKRGLRWLGIVSLAGMGVIPNKLSLMEIEKWQQTTETTPAVWILILLFSSAVLTGKCLILFYWWRVATRHTLIHHQCR